MDFDIAALDERAAYKLLISVIVPRPIALVTTLGFDGRVNAAPFSFFNMLADDPPLVALGLGARPDDDTKDTTRNIRDTQAFVVNMVDEAIAERMIVCAIDFPREIEEIHEAGLTTMPSSVVAPPRLAESPVSLECTRYMTIELGKTRNIVFGQVVRLHIRDDLVDTERYRVHMDKLRLVGRFGGNRYCRTSDQFDMPRIPYESWKQRKS